MLLARGSGFQREMPEEMHRGGFSGWWAARTGEPSGILHVGILLKHPSGSLQRFAVPRERPTERARFRAGHTLTGTAVLLVAPILTVLVPVAPESAGDALAASALHQALAAAGWGRPGQRSRYLLVLPPAAGHRDALDLIPET